MNFPKKLIAVLTLLPALAFGAEGGHPLDAAPERALYAIDRGVQVDGRAVEAQQMVVIPPGATPTLQAPDGARV